MIKPKWYSESSHFCSSILAKLIKKMQSCKESIDDTDKTHKTSQISLVAKPQALLDDSKLESEMSRTFFFQSLSLGKWTADCCSSHNVCCDVSLSIKLFQYSIKYSTVQPVWEEYKTISLYKYIYIILLYKYIYILLEVQRWTCWF